MRVKELLDYLQDEVTPNDLKKEIKIVHLDKNGCFTPEIPIWKVNLYPDIFLIFGQHLHV